MPPKLTKADIKRKAFVKDLLSGKSQTQAYKDNIATKEVSDNLAAKEGSLYVRKRKTQEELENAIRDLSPEYVLDGLKREVETAPLPDTRIKGLIALGNTRKCSVFKDSTPSITNNTLNVFDLDELRRRLADTSYSNAPITDQLT